MATWYRTGTIDVTNGSPTVTGTGTLFSANVQVGDALHAPDGKVYEIVGVVSDTSLTITPVYLGTTATGGTYVIQPTRGWTKRVLDELDLSNTDVETMLAGPGAGKFPDGTLAQPGVRFTADEDTGIRRVGSNDIAIVAGGADKFRTAGNVASGDVVQSSPTDVTAGKLMTVGAFGLGAAQGGQITDFTVDLAPGFYRYAESTVTGGPGPGSTFGCTALVNRYTSTGITILAMRNTGSESTQKLWLGTRATTTGSIVWREVVTLDSVGDLNIVGKAKISDDIILSAAPLTKIYSSDITSAIQIATDATSSGPYIIQYGSSHAVLPNTTVQETDKMILRHTDGVTYFLVADVNGVAVGLTGAARKLHVRETADASVSRIENIHATFGAACMELNATRAATGVYSFAKMWSGNFGDMEFNFSGIGNGTCDGSWTGGGADYAEYFEWADGNPNGEDRRGTSVVLVGDQIREARAGETPIGVISGNPSVVGDAAPFRWKGKYLRDDFGTTIMEDYETVSWTETVTKTEIVTELAVNVEEYTETVVEVTNGAAVQKVITKTRDVPIFDDYPLADETGNDLGTHKNPRMIEITRETTKEVEHSYAEDAVPEGLTVPVDAVRVTQQRRALNPSYDPASEYTPREDRPEWDTVGLMGKLRLRKGQVTGAGWIRMRDVSADVAEWLVK